MKSQGPKDAPGEWFIAIVNMFIYVGIIWMMIYKLFFEPPYYY